MEGTEIHKEGREAESCRGARRRRRRGGEVLVGGGADEMPRPKKRAKTIELTTGPKGEPEMEATEAACKR